MTRSGPARPRLILMTRFPHPGGVKTRLAASVGDAEAARIHAELTEHCAWRMRAAELSGAVDLEARVAGPTAGRAPASVAGWAPPDPRRWPPHVRVRRPQPGGDLGARLAAALRTAFAEGAPAAIAIGSDCPDLGGRHVRAACAALEDHAVVLGPATDGGYYLVGLRAEAAGLLPELFGDLIPWGTPDVLERTRGVLRRLPVRVAGFDPEPAMLEPLSDVDDADDLAVWKRAQAARVVRSVSCVIPSLDEADTIGDAVAAARHSGCGEVIVADASPDDATAEASRHAGARVIRSERGRARQMNAGAAEAVGEALVFVHADTLLPATGAADIRAAFAAPGVSGGAFRFAAGDPRDPLDRLLTSVGRARYDIFRLPYGDQALFVRAADFHDLGVFPDMPTMEDYEFALRLSRLGTLARTASEARTSTRAWRERGVVRSTLANTAVIAGYRLGVDPHTLARWRRHASSRA